MPPFETVGVGPLVPAGALGGDPFGGLADAGKAVLDVPADAINAATGTGRNLGFFGDVDRALDPRPDPPDVDPTPENTGLSGFLRGAGGAVGSAVGQTGSAAVAGATGGPGGLVAVGALAALAIVAGGVIAT